MSILIVYKISFKDIKLVANVDDLVQFIKEEWSNKKSLGNIKFQFFKLSCLVGITVEMNWISKWKLLDLIRYHQVKLIWGPVHLFIEKNEKANVCTVIESFFDESMICNGVQILLVAATNKIDTFRILRMIWPYPQKELQTCCLSIRLLVSIITGHCMIGRESERRSYPGNGVGVI